MKKIKLSAGKYALVDDSDYEWLSQWKWSLNISYAQRKTGGRKNQQTIYMHRLIMNAPAGFDVDHINGDGLDNRRENLRIVTHALNLRNAKIRKDNKTGYKGVIYDKSPGKQKRYRASIRHDKKSVHLGTFFTPEEAGKAYNEKALELFGEFARVNDI